MSKANEYGVSLSHFYSERNSREIAELMAIDLMRDDEYVSRIKFESHTDGTADSALIALLGGKNGNN